jgi:lipopolysaccharide transport system permease protein
MTLILTFVFSKLFNSDIHSFAPYILSGVIVWECITASVMGGTLAFVQADAYIKQTKHPLAIYTLRCVITNLIVLALASITLFIWAAIVLTQNIGFHWLSALTVFPLLALILWPLATLLAYFGARFRDIPHSLALVMQVIWFLSPIYFEAKLFRAKGINALVDYNPIYHLLQLVRAPLIDGTWPTLWNYSFTLLTALILMVLAGVVGKKMEEKTIFFL